MANPVAYAEQQLGVHSIYESVVASSNELADKHSAIVAAKAKKRLLEETLADVEMDLVQNERGKNPDMSQAAMDKHLKVVIQADPEHRNIRAEIRDATSSIETSEAERSIVEADIRIGCSRMTELGGYLEYLAAVKMSRPARTAQQITEKPETQSN